MYRAYNTCMDSHGANNIRMNIYRAHSTCMNMCGAYSIRMNIYRAPNMCMNMYEVYDRCMGASLSLARINSRRRACSKSESLPYHLCVRILTPQAAVGFFRATHPF